MKSFKLFERLILLWLVTTIVSIAACYDDDAESICNCVEAITKVTLIFTNNSDSTDVVRSVAEDPDGQGVEELVVLGSIDLATNTTYTLTYEIEEGFESPAEDFVEIIKVEKDEQQFFYSFTEGAFSDPTGNGNIDNASDSINYLDFDCNNYPLGLETTWTTSATTIADGQFKARLNQQPGEKTATSGADVGESDFDLTFVLNIQ